MSEADEIKQKKLEELQLQADSQQKVMEQQFEMDQKIDSLLRNLLTQKGRERLNNVKLVNRANYYAAAQGIISMAQGGKLRGKLDDAQVKELLSKLMFATKRDFTIKRK